MKSSVYLGDKLGLLLAWFSMLPFIYIVSLCTLILFRRDIQTVGKAFRLDESHGIDDLDNVFRWILYIGSVESLSQASFQTSSTRAK